MFCVVERRVLPSLTEEEREHLLVYAALKEALPHFWALLSL